MADPRPPSRARKPVWREIEEREAHRLSNRARQATRQRRRLAVVYDIEGPRVRLGIGWFLLVMAALAVGSVGVAVLYGGAAAIAAAQTAVVWKQRGSQPNQTVASAGALSMAVAAAVSTPVLGLAVLAFVAVAFSTAATSVRHGGAVEAGRHSIAAAARTLQSGIFAGGAAAAVVCTHRFEIGAAVALVLVVSAYEVGDYIVGSGGRSAAEGPVAGIAALLVVQFGVSALGIPPFELPDGLAYAALAGVLCPAGQLVASLILPSVRAPASALRRLDSLIVLGPVWALVAGAAAAS
ncbi:MAG: hypothetical protein ACRD0G_18905 [Acidimicrobiales bacterium]